MTNMCQGTSNSESQGQNDVRYLGWYRSSYCRLDDFDSWTFPFNYVNNNISQSAWESQYEY